MAAGHQPAARRQGRHPGLVDRACLVLAIVVGFLAFGVGTLRLVPEYATPILISLFALQLVGWMLTPLLAFGVDETVDPARFALLPIRPQTLQVGLLMTSVIGLFPLANFVVLIGAAVALGVPWSVLPVALVCVVLQLLICVVLSRAASTSMSALMSSRRGRDLGMALGLVIFLAYMAFVTLINNSGRRTAGRCSPGSSGAASVLQWTPPGALAALPGSGRRRRVGFGRVVRGDRAGRSCTGLVVVVGGATAQPGHRAVNDRRIIAGRPRARRHLDRGGRGRDRAGGGRPGPGAGVAGSHAPHALADADRAHGGLAVPGGRGKGAVFAVAFGAVFCGAQAGNQYGVEGSGLWLHLQTITDRVRARGEVVGHAITALIPGTVVVLVAIAILAVVRDDYDKFPAAIGVCLAALMGSTAAASYLSARVPYAQPQSRKSLFASSVPGQKGRTLIASLGLIGGGVLVALPGRRGAVLSMTVAPVWGWVALVLGLVCGALALWIAARMTANRFLDQATEIFAVVSAGDRV